MYTLFLKYWAVILPCPINEISHPANNDYVLQRPILNHFTIFRNERLVRQSRKLLAINTTTCNEGLSVLHSRDKEGDKEYEQEVLQEAWESADDWFHK